MAKEKSKHGQEVLEESFACRRGPASASPRALMTCFAAMASAGLASKPSPKRRARNKMTLYRHFGSKDDLILEYLNYKGKKSDEIWTEIERSNPGDRIGQLYGFMEQAAKFIAEDERGCDLANAAVELTEAGHPGLRVIEEFKVRQRDRLAALCRAAGALQPGSSPICSFSIEGARVSRRSRNRRPERKSRADQQSGACVIRRHSVETPTSFALGQGLAQSPRAISCPVFLRLLRQRGEQRREEDAQLDHHYPNPVAGELARVGGSSPPMPPLEAE